MELNDTLPIIRNIEALPVGEENQPTFLLSDPSRLAEHSLTVSPPVIFCLQFFDGNTQVATLKNAWHDASGGQELPLDHLASIIERLDEAYLLDNERSRERIEQLRQEFLASPVRPARNLSDGDQTAELLNECYRLADMPLPDEIANENNDLALLVAPHIDYMRGGSAWALAYGAAKKSFSGDVVLIFGTNHQYHEYPIALTRKNYETSLGLVETDTALVEELATAMPFDVFADEYAHRDEHSIELAALALKHAFGEKCPKIVPILCGSLDDFMTAGVDPLDNEIVNTIRNAFRRVIEREGRRLLVVASVDFAHIGPQFGDQLAVDEPGIEKCLEQDKKMLAAICGGNAKEFTDIIMAERNSRHVCGVSPLFYALDGSDTEQASSSSLHYWRAEDGFGAVTFGTAILPRATTPK